MSERQAHPIGNPVDTWWETIRNEISESITLLGQFPPAPNSIVARQLVSEVKKAYLIVQESPYPSQASPARLHLLNSLNHLLDSLKQQIILGLNSKRSTHSEANRQFMTFTQMLLKRGIYEPPPAQQSARR